MQDIHSIGGARIFGGGDRRLRPLHHQNHQALKCPRCDSLNTKFCYYNNYNLSQPRHFCKNCRRYWTKGGVLRNVPVGGGCRKTKRNSKPKPGSDLSQQQHEKERKTTTNNNNNVNNNNNNNNNNSNSSASDSSSSLTVTNNTNVETVSVHSSSGSVSNVFGFTTGCTGEDNNGGFNQLEQGQDCGNIFPEIGSFTSLIASSSNEPLHFGFNNFLNINPSLHDDNHVHQQWHQHVNHDHRPAKLVNCGSVEAQENLKSVQGTTDALMDQTAQIGFSGLHDDRSVGHNSNGDFGPLDWQDTAGDDRGLFDLTSAVDHSSYWSQTTTTHEWSDHQGHPNLYLP